MKRTIIVLTTLVVLFCLFLGVVGFFLMSATGLQTSLDLLSRISDNRVVVGDSSGRILGGWQVADVFVSTDSADISIEKISCKWEPGRLLQGDFHVADITVKNTTIEVKSDTDAVAETSESPSLPQLTIPVSFFIGQLHIDDFSVTKDLNELFKLNTFSAHLSGQDDQLLFEDVKLSAQNFGGMTHGRLTMSGGWPVDLAGNWWIKPEMCSRLKGDLQVSGAIADPLVKLTLVEPEQIELKSEITDLLGEISYQVGLHGSEVSLDGICPDWPQVMIALSLESTGTEMNYSGSLQSTAVVGEIPPISTQATFTGNDKALTINSGTLAYGENKTEITGLLNWYQDVNWNGVLVADSLDLSPFAPFLKTLLDAEVIFSGGVSEDGVYYLAEMHGLELELYDGNLYIDGDLALKGDQQHLEVSSSKFMFGQGEVGVEGTIGWVDGLSWNTILLAHSLDPSIFGQLPDGSINAKLESTGSFSDGATSFRAIIHSMDGVLSGYELSGGGDLTYLDQKLTLSNLHLLNGENRLQIKGEIDDTFDLSFAFNGAELDRIYPLINGNLALSGTVHGPRDNPSVQVKADGSELSFEENFVNTLQGTMSFEPKDRTLQASLSLAGLNAGEFEVERLALGMDGGMEEHRITGDLNSQWGSLSLTVAGGLFDEKMWRGQLSAIQYKDDRFGAWGLTESTNLSISKDALLLDRACISSEQNNVCTTLSWQKDTSWEIAITDLTFRLAELNSWNLMTQPINGTLAGEVLLSGEEKALKSAKGTISVDEIQIDLDENEFYPEFKWFDTELSFRLENQDLITEFRSRFIDDSKVDGIITVVGAGDNNNQFTALPVLGKIDLNLVDLSPLSLLTSDFLTLRGHLAADLEIGGYLAEPTIAGAVTLEKGEMRLPQLGIAIGDISGTLEATGESLDLDLNGVSKDGQLQSTGKFEFGAQPWNGSFNFVGTQLELLKTRAVHVIADPDLNLEISSNGGRLSGTLAISQALLEVEKIDRSDSESSDVVFVDEPEESSSWPFDYSIAVNLGDDVKVVGYGLSGNLAGFLEVTNSADGHAIGRGFLDVVNGVFNAYGSLLEISRGRLSFNGGPVGNPGLDIKATKQVNENGFGSDGVEVGVEVTGSAADFEVELYSIPNMPEADILSYMLLDRSFASKSKTGTDSTANESDQGGGLRNGTANLLDGFRSIIPVDQVRMEGGLGDESSLVVGKSLSKNLSVSYDYNLFKNAGSFRVKYEFGKGFSVESRNSMESTGAELMYSLER